MEIFPIDVVEVISAYFDTRLAEWAKSYFELLNSILTLKHQFAPKLDLK